MINVSTSFIKLIRNGILKEKNLSPSDYVFCFVINDTKEGVGELSFLVVPIEEFETDEREAKLPFKNFLLFKKDNCWLASNVTAFMYLINKRVTLNKKGETAFVKAPKRGKYSFLGFVGDCLLQHIKNEKLTKEELSKNLKIPISRLKTILKGMNGTLAIDDMIAISFELQGKNKVATYSVLVEKYKKHKTESEY